MRKSAVSGAAAAIKQPDGKFTATRVYTAEESRTLPPLACTSIDGTAFDLHARVQQAAVTLVSVVFSAASAPHALRYKDAFKADAMDAQTVDICPVMSTPKWLLLRLAGAAPARHEPATVVPCNPRWFVFHMGIPNDTGCYVYVVDRCGRIRWSSSGCCTDADVASMRDVLRAISTAQCNPTPIATQH
jgi:hypothetical protein